MGSAEDEALLAEIARLTGQIDQAKAHPTSTSTSTSHAGSPYYHQQSYSGYYGGSGSGSGSYHASARGGYARGRGRGAPSAGGPPSNVSRHRKLVLNNGDSSTASPSASTSAPSSAVNPSGSQSTSTSTGATAERATSAAGAGSSGWVKRKTTHNMSLVSADTFEKTEPARIAALQASQEAKAAARAAKRASSSSSSIPNKSLSAVGRNKPKGSSAAVRRGDNMGEVIIDGVVFVFDETGTKLVKKVQQQSDSESASNATGATTATDPAAPGEQASEGAGGASKAPLRTSVNGQAFVRTKRGNLISAELLEKRKAQKESAAKLKRMAALGRQIGDNERIRSSGKKSRNKTLSKPDQGPKGLCSFFTKTGQCKRGLSCPYAHDPAKLAICPGALRPTGCTQPPGLCPLSHSLSSPERIPHCVHFLRSAGKSCRNGEECRYLHPPPALTAEVLSKEDCPVCMDFARLGWCERGKGCTARHTFDCADFLEKGSCERKGCRLQHNVVAREKMVSSTAAGAGLTATGEQLAAQGSAVRNPVTGEEGASTEEVDLPSTSSGLISANHGAATGSKRKRGGRAGEPVPLVEPQEEEEGVSFVGGGKRKKAFQQKDFISFDDDDDDEEEDEEEGEDKGRTGGETEDQGDVSEVDSVSSEDDDDESSDGESKNDEEDEDAGSDTSSDSDSDDSSSEGSSE
ncbi:hypothetical protein BCV69DRAFT_166932 [Microstroma glucosiphilum]|uniref:C3H1-type domain-containing protein n=1 Tax=Pseudomicrostroma glucosiphilum TaxID=1684307 RepID=A0A316U905_9BASI|nr:hypothetical protein BCV69DRAFT_166932 [Pseudomicrostroma glucosiphilum]PWN21324.1 hypothetical protein BCV69DRAFT_166932 [Pseudomicrostroma glucosiphilum]